MNIRRFDNVAPSIASTAYIDPSAVVIGNVAIGEHASLWPMVVVRGDVNHVHIGACTNIQDGTVVHCTQDAQCSPGRFATHIGDHVTIGHNAVVHACTVGDFSLIGMSCTVMDGAVIESKVMLGAGSLVPPGKRLESGYLWVGAPARKVRALSSSESESLVYSAEHYVKLKNRYLKME
ncbi:MAG: gamma carbonic anhydrase family protein [Gammaproteobacteria bacterium]